MLSRRTLQGLRGCFMIACASGINLFVLSQILAFLFCFFSEHVLLCCLSYTVACALFSATAPRKTDDEITRGIYISKHASQKLILRISAFQKSGFRCYWICPRTCGLGSSQTHTSKQLDRITWRSVWRYKQWIFFGLYSVFQSLWFRTRDASRRPVKEV